MTTAAIYTRVSQDSRGTARSVTEQETECRAWADREGWDVLGVWCDNDVSASRYARRSRPQWQALMERLGRGGVDVLVVWEPSRATRDRTVWAALAALCQEHGIRIGWSGRLYDVDDPDQAFDLDLQFSLATRESGTTRKRVQRAVRAAAERGLPHGKVPYGYRREYAEGPKGPVLVAQVEQPEQAAVVREVARRVSRGEALYAVAADLNARGVPGPRSDRWDPTQVRRLCTSPTYIAKRVHQGRVVGDGQWPALLDELTHYTCVQRLSDPKRRTNEGRGARHLLSGLARCGVCGAGMVVGKGRGSGSWPVYVCRQGFCTGRKQSDVDELLTAVVLARLAQPDLLALMTTEGGDPERAAAAAEVAEKRARLDGFYDLAATGELTPAALARIEATLLPQIADAERRARPRGPSPLLGEVQGPDAAARWEGLSLEQRREVIDLLCEVRVLPVGRGKRTFDPRSVRITWRTSTS